MIEINPARHFTGYAGQGSIAKNNLGRSVRAETGSALLEQSQQITKNVFLSSVFFPFLSNLVLALSLL
jgi:hypothetical protein